MLSWEADSTKICEIIRSHKSRLKIVLKIQDDFDMFDDFYDHHCARVGPENIYVFDNGSTNEDLLNRYRRFGNEAFVFSFSGFHNNLHFPSDFPALYNALRDSSAHYTFLDSDERMCLVNEQGWANDDRLIHYLESLEGVSIPGIWLSNAAGSKNIFNLSVEHDELLKGLNWGKPIFSSSEPVAGYLNHNVQAIEHIKNGLMHRNIFILHLNHLSPRQRISANIRKLVARGFVPKGASPEDVINAEQPAYEDQNIGFYVDEIKTLCTTPPATETHVAPGQIVFSHSGEIDFFSDVEKEQLHSFINRSSTFARYTAEDNAISVTPLKMLNAHDHSGPYKGHIDSTADGHITGWAVDGAGEACSLRVLIDGTESIIVHTVQDRADLERLGISKGQGGFIINLKGAIPNGTHVVQLLFSHGEPFPGGHFFIEA